MMKPTLRNAVYLTIRKDATRKDGSNSLILRLKIGGKKKDISLGEFCPINAWDEVKGRVKRSYPYSENINNVIEGKLNRANQIIYEYKIKDKALSIDDFCRDFGIQNSKSFLEFINQEIEIEKGVGSKSEGTISNYRKDLSKLKRFVNELYFSELTRSFLEKYEAYMRNDLKNNRNTINRSMRFIRNFNNRAINKGLTESYPFKQFKLSTEKTKLRFLDFHELKLIQSYYDNLPSYHKHQKTLKPYLFCCYTGLRYSDVCNLRFKDMQSGTIYFRIKKTTEPIRIPLCEQAKKLIGINIDSESPIFKVPCNQTVNRCLKDVALLLSINKTLTFHTARHTFATVGLNIGIDIMTIKELLGHSDLKQTQVYAKLMEKTKEVEMEKWNVF